MYGQRDHRNPGNRRNQTPYENYGQQNFTLADKLRREYRGRGENLRGIGVASTEELMARAQMGQDPRENVSEEAFSDRLRNPNYTYDRSRYHSSTQTFSRPQTNRTGSTVHATHQGNRTGRERARGMPQPDVVPGEVQVKAKSLSLGYILMLATITVMVIMVLFSIAQVYRTSNTIADRESQLRDLRTTASKLELAIEEKNDIRVIEQIASDQLGMVKEDSVQRKYISLSDGERIDVIGEEENTVSEGIFGTMLSSLVSVWERFFGNGNG